MKTAEDQIVQAPEQPYHGGILVPRLVGFAGFASSGKDTAGDVLAARMNYVKFSFSDALYREVEAAYGVPLEFLYARETKEVPTPDLALVRCNDAAFVVRMVGLGVNPDAPQSPRCILQWWGTEYRRADDPDYWVKRAREFFRRGRQRTSCGFANVSVRFPNEVAWIREERGLIIQLQRPGVVAVNGHTSDVPVPAEFISAVVHNDGTPDDLFWKLMDIFDLWRSPAVPV